MKKAGLRKRVAPSGSALRKCIAVIFISLLIYDFGGYYLRFSLSQNHIRREIKMEMRKWLLCLDD